MNSMKAIQRAVLVGLTGIATSITALAHAAETFPCNSPINDPSSPSVKSWGAPGCSSSYTQVGCYYDGTPPVDYAGGTTYANGRGKNCSGVRAVEAYAFGGLAARATADGAAGYYAFVTGLDGSGNALCSRADFDANATWSSATNCSATPATIKVIAVLYF